MSRPKTPVEGLVGARGEPPACSPAIHWFPVGENVCVCGETTREVRRPTKRLRRFRRGGRDGSAPRRPPPKKVP